MKGITLGADKKIYEVAGKASGMGLNLIDHVGKWSSEEQAAGLYRAGFAVSSLAGLHLLRIYRGGL
jgi:hypothetical protein